MPSVDLKDTKWMVAVCQLYLPKISARPPMKCVVLIPLAVIAVVLEAEVEVEIAVATEMIATDEQTLLKIETEVGPETLMQMKMLT